MINVEGGGLIDELRRRREKAGGTVGVLLWAPDSLRWWYFHEWGTAGGYSITPVNAELLRWPDPNAQGGWRTATHVTHPGVPAKAFIRKVLADIEVMAGREVMNAFILGDHDMVAVQAAMLDPIGKEAKKMIVESMAKEFGPQTREGGTGGKLDGQAPADVFDAEVEILPLT